MMDYGSGWVNPYAATMSDEIARSGDAQAHAAQMIAQAQARAAEIKGAAWSNAVGAIASLPRSIEASSDRKLDQRLKREALATSTAAKEDATRRGIVTTIGRLAEDAATPEDFTAGLDNMVGLGGLPKQTADHIKAQVTQAGPEAWGAVKDKYVKFGAVYEQAYTMKEGDKRMRGTTPIATNPKPVDMAPGHVVVQPGVNGAPPVPIASAPFAPGTGQHVVNGQVVDATGAAVGAAIPKQETPSEAAARGAQVAANQARVKEIEARLNGTVPITAAEKAKLALERDRLTAEAKHWDAQDAAVEAAPDLTQKGKELLALNFAKSGGALPTLGQGKAGTKLRAEVINMAADVYDGLDLASQKAAYSASKDSLVAIQKQADAVDAFENTAKKNIDLFLEKAKKVGDTGIPFLNAPLRWADNKILGGKEVPEYEAARRSAIAEIAKVVNTPGLSGQLSDSARHEIESFSEKTATLGQAIGVMETLNREMDNRHESYQQQIEAIKKRIANPPVGASGAPAATRPGYVRVKGPNGETGQVPEGQSLPAGWTKVGG
jgi:hypothetical protein